ncbi:MAG: DUF3160 domain-containing protein [Deltaproteobacteria bacterium]|jgi:hypothetical protein|nr:DUF3160 domain-containing protein [Deltaproteobacteria bacterium]
MQANKPRIPASAGLAALSALAAAILLPGHAALAQAPDPTGEAAAPASAGEGSPAFNEAPFDARKAWNWREMEKAYGPFSQGQLERLNRDRFLVVPQRPGMELPWGSAGWGPYDEMLGMFDGMGGPWDPTFREPRHARFVGPDVVLHAFHKYFSEKLKAMERTALPWYLEAMLAGAYENALAMRESAAEAARPGWDLAIAEMAVPLTLLETRSEQPANPWDPEPPGGDTLGAALAAFARREGDLPESLRQAVRAALAKVYTLGASTEGPEPAAALRLRPAYNSPQVDWTQFAPRSHYEENSRTRAYFRAMIWLGQLGWDRGDPAVLPPVVAWASALAGPGGEGFARAAARFGRGDPPAPASPAEAWRAVMRITSFFVGFYDDPSVSEAMELASASGSPPGPDAPGDPAFLAGIAPGMAALAPAPAGFDEFHTGGYEGTGAITVLPQRFTVPWLVASELTTEKSQIRGVRSSLPARFSGLYLAMALGSGYAGSLAAGEVEKGLERENVSRELAEAMPGAVAAKAAELAASLARVPESDWRGSVGAAWFGSLRSFSREYGAGYPLYMQGPAFAAKQLETLMGGFTELKHDTILYEKPNYAELGEGGDDERPKRLPKGFVEPNMAFWERISAACGVLEDGFRRNGLFPDEQEEFGTLGRFKSDLARLEGIARKELAGERVSDEDYEFVRTFQLEGMAARPGNAGGNPELNLSGLVVDVQTVISGDEGVVHEGLGPPSLMLVLVGNDGEERVTVGTAYNHFEFFVRPVRRLTDSKWKAAAYPGMPFERYLNSEKDPEFAELPPKPNWYDPLVK